MKRSETRLWHVMGQVGTMVALAGLAAWLLAPSFYLLASYICIFVGLLIVLRAVDRIGEVHADELDAEHAWRQAHGLENAA